MVYQNNVHISYHRWLEKVIVKWNLLIGFDTQFEFTNFIEGYYISLSISEQKYVGMYLVCVSVWCVYPTKSIVVSAAYT